MNPLWLGLLLAFPLLADPAPYGQFLDLGGYKVHYQCQGQGTQTVVLLHGTPRFSLHFALIQPGIARFSRVCSYDRAGEAWSDTLPNHPTNEPKAQLFVDELDRFLDRISPQSPVVLAGHSVGGVLARAYYAQHPTRVSAMVLIDTAPADGPPATDEQIRAQADLDRARITRPPVKRTMTSPFNLLPLQFRAAHLWATDKWYAYAYRVDPYVALKYEADFYTLARAVRNPGLPNATLPVWVVTRSNTIRAPEPWVTRQAALASIWTNSHLIRAPGSGHDIQIEHPNIVIQAVRDAVSAAAASDHRSNPH